jgi:phosphoglycolate phosphatase-like HAD superfamily hydrolase
MKLVLFDIDGTILLTSGAGKRAVHRALAEVFGAPGRAEHRFDGKTDPQIVRELMRMEGHADDHIDERMSRMLDRYVDYLHEELDHGDTTVRLMPGVAELLDALEARPDVVLGLVTGNLAAGAAAKLRAGGIDPERFRVGAFGSDHELRVELPGVAQRRARDELGVHVEGADVVVIGDTPADVECGRAIGARTIGVATGYYTVDELRKHLADEVFEDLADTAGVVRAIVGG